MVQPTAAGWHPDPQQPGLDRYWFGAEWSSQTRPSKPWHQGSAAAARPPVPTPTTYRRIPQWAATVAIELGGMAMMIGSITTWVTVSAGIFSDSAVGTHDGGDGWITMVLGAALAFGGVALPLGWWRCAVWIVATPLLALGAFAVCLYEVIHILSLNPNGYTSGLGGLAVHFDVSIGGGLILAVIASVAALAGGVDNLMEWGRVGRTTSQQAPGTDGAPATRTHADY